jgi:hypothetical protein
VATNAQLALVAQACEDVANAGKAWLVLVDQLLTHNSTLSIDWPNADAEAVASVTEATRQQVSDFLGTLAAVQTLMGQGHRGNIEKLSKPIS